MKKSNKNAKKFMCLPDKFSGSRKSKVVIIPIAYEGKVSCSSGAFKGPDKIIKASKELEYFDSDLKVEPYEVGIYLEEIYKVKEQNYSEVTKKITSIVGQNKHKFPIVLGGDHSITLGIINNLEKDYDDLGIVIFDAHADLREPWGKETWWHACVSRELSKKHRLLIAGVRTLDFYENEFLKSNKHKVKVIRAEELISSKKNSFDLLSCPSFEKSLGDLPNNIYISIDVDVFDPSIIRNTNTPEPGGINWFQINNLLKKVFKSKNVVGVDITEFAPKGKEENYISEAYTLSKLIYKLIVYKFYKEKI